MQTHHWFKNERTFNRILFEYDLGVWISCIKVNHECALNLLMLIGIWFLVYFISILRIHPAES